MRDSELMKTKTTITVIINTNLVIISDGIFFGFWFWNKNQSAWAAEKSKDEYDETTLLWFTSQLNNGYL